MAKKRSKQQRQEDERRKRVVKAARKRLLERIQQLRKWYLEVHFEEAHEGTAFDCWILDQFKELDRQTLKLLSFKKFKALRK